MRFAVLMLAAALVAACSVPADADVPKTMSYQGVLTDADGVPVEDGGYGVEFRIYDVETGGTALWSESQLVIVTDGIFNVTLGTVEPLGIAFDVPYWLGTSIEGDPELVPLTELTSAPYALRAAVAESLSGGAVNDHDWEFDGDDIYRLTGRVGIGTSDPAAPLVIKRDHDSNTNVMIVNAHTGQWSGALLMLEDEESGKGVIGFYDSEHPFHPDALVIGNERGFPGGPIKLRTRSSDRVYVSAEGNVGIGTVTPAERLDVAGTTRTTGFILPTGAVDGHVLVSDSAGEGTWQPAPGGIGGGGTNNYIPRFTGSLTIGNSVIRQNNDGDVIVGGELHVDTSTTRAGEFTSNHGSSLTSVLHAEFTGSGSYDVAAVRGHSVSQDGYGRGGSFLGGYDGVQGLATPTGTLEYHGVSGGAIGGNGDNMGVYGLAIQGDHNYAIYGDGGLSGSEWAGYFAGDVHITGTLTGGKAGSRIDHPLDPANSYLNHAYVESPEMKNVYDGVAILDESGEARVVLAEWFEAVNSVFRYQLTAIGAPGPNLYIAEKISGNAFTIAGGEPGMEVSWQVTGIRSDPFSEAGRIVVEEEKPADEVGKYMHPEAYGLPREMGVSYREPPRMLSSWADQLSTE